MTTIFNDRFRTEKDFGTKFCYTLDRTLQIFFDRATKWTDAAIDGEPDYSSKGGNINFENNY